MDAGPDDPIAPADAPLTPQADGDGTPRRRPLGAATAVAVTTAVVLAAMTIVWATRLPPRDDYSASAFLPPNGEVVLATTTTGTASGSYMAEHAVVRGVGSIAALPTAFGGALLTASDALGLDPMRIVTWRETGRRTDAGTTSPAFTTLYVDAPTGIHSVAWFGGPLSAAFDPPFIVLPAERSQGYTWSARGDALPGGILTYRYEGEIVEVRADGCVVIDAMLALDQDTESFSVTDTRDTWCPGRGLVESEGTYTSDTSTDVGLSPGTDVALPEFTGAVDSRVEPNWGAPSTWSLGERNAYMVDQLFGEQALTLSLSLPSVVTGDDGVAMAIDNTDDVAVFEPTPSGLEERWRGHPGGKLLALGAVGDMVVVTTAEREVVAYDAAGVRRWTAATDDLVLARPTATPDGLAVTVGLDGRVIARRAIDGELAWSGSLATDADVSATAIGDVVVATDRSGTLRAFDATDGQVMWTNEIDPVVVLAVGANGEIVAVDDAAGTATAFDAQSGDELWSADTPPGGQGVVAFGSATVVVTPTSTLALDAQGSTLWRAPGGANAIADADTLVVLAGDELLAIDDRGETVDRWALPTSTVATVRRVVGGAAAIWMIDNVEGILALEGTP